MRFKTSNIIWACPYGSGFSLPSFCHDGQKGCSLQSFTQALRLLIIFLLSISFSFSACKKEGKNLPILTTDEINLVTQTTAVSGGKISDNGGSEIVENGICFAENPNPTVADNMVKSENIKNAFSVEIMHLQPNTKYYIRAFAKNINGIGYGNEQFFKTSTFTIGDQFGGGIVFYIEPSGKHGLIASQFDANIGTDWGCFGTSFPLAQSEAIGAGITNTQAILKGCATPNIAARICDNYVLGGYTDWFLPSKEELNLLYNAKDMVGGFSDYYYWSSTESRIYYAWIQAFLGGTQGTQVKSSLYRVRAIRSF